MAFEMKYKHPQGHLVQWSQTKEDLVIELLTDYLSRFYSGEMIYQDDEAQEKAVELMSEIADIVEPIEK